MGALKRSKKYAKKLGEKHKAKPALPDAFVHYSDSLIRSKPMKRVWWKVSHAQ